MLIEVYNFLAAKIKNFFDITKSFQDFNIFLTQMLKVLIYLFISIFLFIFAVLKNNNNLKQYKTMTNITPTQISELKSNEVFVFGSNLQGDHAGGAARFAVMHFGAKMGQYEGLQGQSYAIPTLSHPGGVDEHKLPLEEIEKYVKRFIEFAADHKELFFYVTPIGCGIAGFTEVEIAPMFAPCVSMENVALPQTFIDKL